MALLVSIPKILMFKNFSLMLALNIIYYFNSDLMVFILTVFGILDTKNLSIIQREEAIIHFEPNMNDCDLKALI